MLVKDNKVITHVCRTNGIYGVGNTNTSGFDGYYSYKSLEEFAGTKIYKNSGGFTVYAAVEDILYVVWDGKVHRLGVNEKCGWDRGIAYDTYELCNIGPVVKKRIIER